MTAVHGKEFLTACVRLLAPRPQVHVFHSVDGYQWGAVEDPITFQVHFGVSWALWKRIVFQHSARTGRDITDQVTVIGVPTGNMIRLSRRPQFPATEVPDVTNVPKQPDDLELYLQPIAFV